MKREIITFILVSFFLSSFSQITAFPQDVFRIQASWINESMRISYTSSPTNPILNKRLVNTNSPFEIVDTLSSFGGEYFDTTAEEGVLYEYLITDGTTRIVECGGKLPLVEYRGWYVILVDEVILSGINVEFKKFRRNLYSDGFRVHVIPVQRSQTPQQIRTLLQQTNAQLEGGIKQVLLLGHVPVPYSGEFGYDVHNEHDGAWATDTYYADLDGVWQDLITVDYPQRDANKNFPGDGKLDHDVMPSAAELEVGRVDMFNLPAFGLSEQALINRYLTKNNLFKSGSLTILGRAIETQGAFYSFGGLLADVAPCVGINGLFRGAYNSINAQPYLFSEGYGASNYDICGGVVSTNEFTSSNWFSVFTALGGSYLWDFDFTNSIMRASIFSNGSILNCAYGSFYWGKMGTGKSIGEVNKLNQTNEKYIISSLQGDPSVRINYPLMPTNLNLSINSDSSEVMLMWNPSNETDEPLIGYNIYRSSSFDSIPVRLNEFPILATQFIDQNPPIGKSFYIVKLITLRSSGSGSFYNSSIGLIDSTVIPNNQQFEWNVNFNLNESYCGGEILSISNIEVLNGVLLDNQLLLEISDTNGEFINPSFSQVYSLEEGNLVFEMPDLINNENYRLKISDLSQGFPDVISSQFTFYDSPALNLSYIMNFDTLYMNIQGNIEFITSVLISPNTQISAIDSIFVFGEEGEFEITVIGETPCGEFLYIDTVISTLNGGIVSQENWLNLSSDLIVYPNPTSNYLYVKSNNLIQLNIYDVQGKLIVISPEYKNEKLCFNFTNLPSGLYYIRDNTNTSKGKMIVKE